MASKENPPFGLLARFYDEILPGMHEMNRQARQRMLGTTMGTVGTVCDLACGNGGTAIELARAGKRVHAVDNSPEFCRIVRTRARAERLPIRVLRADMRNFRIPEPVDLVTCEFSSLNNLTDPRDLARIFRAVFQALRPGGRFLFDVNTLLSLDEQCRDTHWFESPRFKLVLRPAGLDLNGQRVRIDLEWFLPAGKLWRHVRETIFNVGWSDREIRQVLRRAGFKRPQFRDGMDVRPPMPGAKRGYDAYYLTRK